MQGRGTRMVYRSSWQPRRFVRYGDEQQAPARWDEGEGSPGSRRDSVAPARERQQQRGEAAAPRQRRSSVVVPGQDNN